MLSFVVLLSLFSLLDRLLDSLTLIDSVTWIDSVPVVCLLTWVGRATSADFVTLGDSATLAGLIALRDSFDSTGGLELFISLLRVQLKNSSLSLIASSFDAGKI